MAAALASESVAKAVPAQATGLTPAVGAADAMVEVEEELPFAELERLQDAGINAADLKKLKEAGYHTASGVAQANKKDLVAIRGLSEAKVEKIHELARKVAGAEFCTAVEMEVKLRKRLKLTTGASKVDALLGGGIESCSITELFGEFRCGKTQLVHTLSVTAQFPTARGGGNGKVCYIDTEGTFRPDRIRQIASRYQGLDPEAVLENILVARCYTSDQLLQLLVLAASKMVEEKFALLVVDSIMGPFRVDYCGRGELAERQQTLGKVLSRLQKLSEEYNVAIVLTNQVMADPAPAVAMAANPPKPVGGHVLAHACTTRLYLRKGRAEQRVMKIYDSPCLPEGDAIFEICDTGICDPRD